MRKRLLLLIGLFLLVLLPAHAQSNQPTVFAVLFYSPSCPHCHDVIDDHLPLMYDEFGDQLEVLFVNVTTEGGGMLTYATCEAYDFMDRCGGVPMMIIGDELLYGGAEIPARMGDIVRTGLANGGIDLPDVPGLQEAYMSLLASRGADSNNSAPAETTDAVATSSESSTVWDRLSADPVANAVAVVVLIGLVVSLGLVLLRRDLVSSWQRGAALTAAGVSALLAVSVLSEGGSGVPAWIALGVLAAMVSLVFLRGRYAVPVVALVGIAVAGYLTHIETTTTAAVCGAIGDCNSVQQSAYAEIFGVPIGVLGVVGYTLILLAWGLTWRNAQLGNAALLGLTLFGTLFSIYLTFLEPFVIGATCAWCLMSALVMALLLWLVAPAGWEALQGLMGGSRRPASKRA